MDDPAGDADDVPFGGVLDDLGQLEPGGQHQPGPTAPPGPDRLAKDPREGGDVAGEAIDADQDGPGHGAGQNPLNQPGDQEEITVPTDHPAQPQARWGRQRERHPDLAADLLHPQLVRLHVLEVDLPLLHQVLMDPLAVPSGFQAPARHRPLIEPECRHNRLRRAAMTQQRDDQHRQLNRLVQPIERRVNRLSERSACTADTGTAGPPDCES